MSGSFPRSRARRLKAATAGWLVRLVVIASLLVSTLGLTACFPLLASGVAIGALAIIDRRTIGAQTEDQAIELKARTRLRQQLDDATGVSATSYNRRVLLTGQVASEADKQAAGALVAGLQNVRGVYNELELASQPSLQVTANDVGVTTRVKTALLRDEIVPGNSVKVKTENSVVYLMGLTTAEEAQRAAELASRTAGVSRVITVFEIISPDEARDMARAAQTQQGGATAQPAASPEAAPAAGAPAAPAGAMPETPPGQPPGTPPGTADGTRPVAPPATQPIAPPAAQPAAQPADVPRRSSPR